MSRQYIIERQVLWAQRKGIELQGSRGDRRGAQVYTRHLDDNLFEPLTKEARAEYGAADGGEFSGDPCKMQALHSSSALAVNFFHYWKRRGDLKSVAGALGLSKAGLKALRFEAQLPIAAGSDQRRFPRAPNLDALIEYDGGRSIEAVGIECKFSEAYGGRGHPGIRPAYLETKALWNGLPRLRRLAEQLSPNDTTFEHLHPAQLIKHILGLRCKYGDEKFRLLYLWYDVPGTEGAVHRGEIDRFAKVAEADGVSFRARSYQEAILAMKRRGERGRHAGYVDYIAERYL